MGREGRRVHVLVVLATVGLAATARADAFDDALAAARKGLVGRLETLAAWAQEQRIAAFRQRVLGSILRLDPDHAKARSALGFRRTSKRAPWVQDPNRRVPADWNLGAVPEAEKRLGSALAWYRDTVMAAVAAMPEGEAGASRAEETLERLLDMVPDDAELRRLRGHVEKDGRWALPETHRALERRRELVALGAAAREKARAGLQVDEESMELDWPLALRSAKRRVLSTLEDAEASRDTLLFMEAGDVVASRVLGAKKAEGHVSILYLFGTKDEARAFLEEKPGLAERRRDLDSVSALPLGGGSFLVVGQVRGGVRTSGVRYVVDHHVDLALPGTRRGWLTEGLGQRVVWYATGAHGFFFVSLAGTERNRAEDEPEEEPLPGAPGEWLAAAARVLERDGDRRLSALLTMRLNAMRSSDVLLAYGLAAYLLEGRPESWLAFARATQESDDAAAAVRGVLDTDLVTLAWRLRRWLRETS